jgi:Nucleotidyl transferase AbiEii toxin, Type IV TA system
MAKQYRTAAAFKAALEAHLRTVAQERNVPFQTLQLKFVIERLLARLFYAEKPPWLLKGGFAMDLRFRPHARTTRDVDLSADTAGAQGDLLRTVRERLQEVAELDLGDHLSYRIGEPIWQPRRGWFGGGCTRHFRCLRRSGRTRNSVERDQKERIEAAQSS